VPGIDNERDDSLIHTNQFVLNELTSEEKRKLEVGKPKQQWNRVLRKISNVSKWKHLASCRRSHEKNNKRRTNTPGSGPLSKRKADEQFYENLNLTLNGIASECEDSSSSDDDGDFVHHHHHHAKRDLSKSSNKALIIYFSKLARSKSAQDELDLDFIESLLNNGADINTTDRYGQTVFHEVARTWHCDVGRFLLEKHGDINLSDKYGRTPLHVASAVNYPEMVKFLIENGGLFVSYPY